MRAKERLYFKADGTTLVREGNAEARKLYCNPGDEISAADITSYRSYFESFGWLSQTQGPIQGYVTFESVHVKHDDASETKTITLPKNSIIQDIFVQCTEAAAGSPDIDFGELGGDTDGILDGLGTAGILDTVAFVQDTSADFKGRGALITSTVNENNIRQKVRKAYPDGVTFTNTKNSAGTAGEWDIHIMYLVLPELNK